MVDLGLLQIVQSLKAQAWSDEVIEKPESLVIEKPESVYFFLLFIVHMFI